MHRTASVNEYSTRYSVAIDACGRTDTADWRQQATTNKQGSDGFVKTWPNPDEVDWAMPGYLEEGMRIQLKAGTPGEYLSDREQRVQDFSREVYEERLKFGVAREQARKDLPLSNYTEAYWKCDLKNLLNFLSLRMDKHAQLEIRQYANVMYDIVKQICPIAVEAFDDYDFRRNALLLSALDVKIINCMQANAWTDHRLDDFYAAVEELGFWSVPPAKNRERDECFDKLIRLGIIRDTKSVSSESK